MARKVPTPSSEEPSGSKGIALDKALGDITKRYGDGAIMRLGEAHQLGCRGNSNRLTLPGYCPGCWRNPSWDGSLKSSVLNLSGKTTICQHIVLRITKIRRYLRLRGYGTCPGSVLCVVAAG